ncbi:MAG: zinc ribbon domain-containing protein [Oscillospiraceae bacterium]|nr:zinc ribbon domain-containing protein [Oscillospiraceae bacterium]
MYCPQCGTQKPPTAAFCPECGLKAPVQPAAFQQPPYPQAPYHGMPQQQHPYQRIGGMLSFLQVIRVLLIIALVLVGIGLAFFSLGVWVLSQPYMAEDLGLYGYEILSVESIYMFAVQMLVFFASSITAVISIKQLLRKSPKFLRTYEISMLLTIAGVVLHIFGLFVTENSLFSSLSLLPLLDLAIYALFCLYFARSVRVRTYMGSDEYISQSLFLRNITPPQPAVPDTQSNHTNPHQ